MSMPPFRYSTTLSRLPALAARRKLALLSDWKRKKRPLVNQAEHQMHQLQQVLALHIGQALAEKRFCASSQTLSYHSQHEAATTPRLVDVDIDGKHTLYIQEFKGTVKMKMTITALFQTFSQFKDEFTLWKIPLNSTESKILYYFSMLECCVQRCLHVHEWPCEQVCTKICAHGGLDWCEVSCSITTTLCSTFLMEEGSGRWPESSPMT